MFRANQPTPTTHHPPHSGQADRQSRKGDVFPLPIALCDIFHSFFLFLAGGFCRWSAAFFGWRLRVWNCHCSGLFRSFYLTFWQTLRADCDCDSFRRQTAGVSNRRQDIHFPFQVQVAWGKDTAGFAATSRGKCGLSPGRAIQAIPAIQVVQENRKIYLTTHSQFPLIKCGNNKGGAVAKKLNAKLRYLADINKRRKV